MDSMTRCASRIKYRSASPGMSPPASCPSRRARWMISRWARRRSSCRPRSALRPHTFATLFGLYVASGLRANEALRLDRDDVDLINGVLTIRDTKFGKTRYVPVHPSTQRALQRYAKLRDRLCRTPSSPRFFLSDRGTSVTYDMLRWTFVKVSRQIGLRGPRDSHGPRLHGLRHRLAINTLLKWHRRGVDVERHLPALGAYLGHAHITDTQWY